MRPSAPNYLPWRPSFVAALALLLALAVVAIELDLVTFAFERLGLAHRVAAALLFGSLLGSAVNGDVGAVLGTLAGLALSFAYIRRRSRSALESADLHPHIVSRF